MTNVKLTLAMNNVFAAHGVRISGDEPCTISDCGYGWLIEPDHHEWALVTQMTGRQDGQMSWAVVLTDVDGVARVRHGLSPTADAAAMIGLAITDLSQEAHWVIPIQVEVVWAWDSLQGAK